MSEIPVQFGKKLLFMFTEHETINKKQFNYSLRIKQKLKESKRFKMYLNSILHCNTIIAKWIQTQLGHIGLASFADQWMNRIFKSIRERKSFQLMPRPYSEVMLWKIKYSLLIWSQFWEKTLEPLNYYHTLNRTLNRYGKGKSRGAPGYYILILC